MSSITLFFYQQIKHEHCNTYEKRNGMDRNFFSARDMNQFRDALSPVDFVVLEKFNVAIEKISLFSLLSPMSEHERATSTLKHFIRRYLSEKVRMMPIKGARNNKLKEAFGNCLVSSQT